MGDRIAIMQKGGKLAQYAPPAELLMCPANRFVEDFVGADRALKRLALQRVRDIDLWKAPLVRVGEPSAEARAKAADSEVPYPLLVDDDGRPLGWLSRARARGRARRPTTCARGPSRWSSSTTCCATRSPTCSPTRPSTARSSTSAARWPACCRSRSSRHALQAPTPTRCPSGADAGRMILELAQVQIHDRTRHVRVEQRLLPRLDRRQLRPLRRPVLPARLPDRGRRGDRLRDLVLARAGRATGAAGWSARSPRSPASSTRSRASRCSSCCCRSPGAATPRR